MTVMRLTMYKIYVVEDDSTIASLLKESLDRWGFESYCCTDFSTVLDEFLAIRPDLVKPSVIGRAGGFQFIGEG